MASVAGAVYTAGRSHREDMVENYNHRYRELVSTLLTYGYEQSVYRENFSDMDKILIENEVLGNITVRDIAKIYADENGERQDYEEKESIAEKKVEKSPTEENQREYQYYSEILLYVRAFEECVVMLDGESFGYEYAMVNTEGEQAIYLKSNADILDDIGFCYYVTYKEGDREYTIANVNSADEIENSNVYKDICLFENGNFVYDENTYGIKNLNNILTGDREIFSTKISELVVGIDASYAHGTDLAEMIENIENAPSEQQLVKDKKMAVILIIAAIISVLISIIPFIMLMLMAGHEEKGDEARPAVIDRLWLDLEMVIGIGVVSTLAVLIEKELFQNMGYYDLAVISSGLLGLASVEFVILFCESFMRRVKTKTLLKTTFLGKIGRMIKRIAIKMIHALQRLLQNVSLTWKVAVMVAVVFIWQIIIIYMTYVYLKPGTAIVLTMIEIVGIFYLVWKYFEENKTIEEGAKRIADGELDYKINVNMKFRANRDLKDCVNNIGEGLKAAVAESTKNERMKTELITNVSHDLKTPLTSIINYVDLLKMDGPDSEKAKQYLDILDRKSQRLKHLTEDLVEISKLNSGAAKLERERLDIVQLVNQSLGEYEEKFAEKNLQIIKTVQEEPLYIMADGRKTWRLFENLYENVYKYAMQGTRVYVDIKREKQKVIVSVKNISESPLNFSAEELMERFVRGDASRTTEGSGLGLSIARSIVERQEGEMKIMLDGDLFKVEIVMNKI